MKYTSLTAILTVKDFMNRRVQIRQKIVSLIDDIHYSDYFNPTAAGLTDKVVPVRNNINKRVMAKSTPMLAVYTPEEKVDINDTGNGIISYIRNLLVQVEITLETWNEDLADSLANVVEFRLKPADGPIPFTDVAAVDSFEQKETQIGMIADNTTPVYGALLSYMCRYRTEEPENANTPIDLSGFDIDIYNPDGTIKLKEETLNT